VCRCVHVCVCVCVCACLSVCVYVCGCMCVGSSNSQGQHVLRRSPAGCTSRSSRPSPPCSSRAACHVRGDAAPAHQKASVPAALHRGQRACQIIQWRSRTIKLEKGCIHVNVNTAECLGSRNGEATRSCSIFRQRTTTSSIPTWRRHFGCEFCVADGRHLGQMWIEGHRRRGHDERINEEQTKGARLLENPVAIRDCTAVVGAASLLRWCLGCETRLS